MAKYKSMTRTELADYAGVSRRTFFRWLSHKEHKKALRKLGAENMKLLPPAAVRYICETFEIDIP